MPIYDYACQKCGHEFEREQRIVDDPVKKCPACGALKAKRLISKTSFVLKGGGWYNDLYSSSGGSAKDDTKEADAGGDASKKDADAGGDASKKDEKKKSTKSEGDGKSGASGKSKGKKKTAA